jgi:hypothetical protein
MSLPAIDLLKIDVEGHELFVQPAGHIQLLEQYDEFYEQYRTTNFVATSKGALFS